ncbi:hypothetical protein TNCV_2399331 [Trichonephila clavipes]|uniref:Uncharacterized protein n=1 Tax=Trichonephila clavipes TaxID=2585209 RepID=A0A8X6T2H8_TRICX|nr:hypothetical protein TNCV_2399331 [Trichonephila clavipes]
MFFLIDSSGYDSNGLKNGSFSKRIAIPKKDLSFEGWGLHFKKHGDESVKGDLKLEVNEDDIEELIMGHEDELTTEEIQEILNEEHQETHRNVSLSEKEED